MLQSARVVFFILLSILAGCASNGIKGDTLSHQQILIQSGEKLGVDLTSPLFAKQTKCYVEPFKLFENPKVWFRSICYQDGTIVTDLFSVRKGVSLQSFVSENVEVIAKDRARNGYTNTDHKSVQFLEEHNGVSYHSIKIGDSFSAVQATIIVELSNPLGLNLAVVVKAVNYESAKRKIEEIKTLALKSA